MDRRQFVAAVGAAALTASLRSAEEQAKEPGKTVSPASRAATENAGARQNTWLPLDWWQVEHQDNVELRQGRPEWVPEATYEDPTFDYLGFWPFVWRDAASGQWRMLYFAIGIQGTDKDKATHKILGEGSFDMVPLVRMLREIDYQGPLGTMGYTQSGGIPAKLDSAYKSWEKIKTAE